MALWSTARRGALLPSITPPMAEGSVTSASSCAARACAPPVAASATNMTVMLEWSERPSTWVTHTATRLMLSAAARLSRNAATLAGSADARPRSVMVARTISSSPVAPHRSAKGRRCLSTPTNTAVESPQRATSGVTVAEHAAEQPVPPHSASKLSAWIVKYCLSQLFVAPASMGRMARHCSVKVSNCGTLTASQSAQCATTGFHSAAHSTVQYDSGPEVQSAVAQHAASSCEETPLTAAAHASEPPAPSCASTVTDAARTRRALRRALRLSSPIASARLALSRGSASLHTASIALAR